MACCQAKPCMAGTASQDLPALQVLILGATMEALALVSRLPAKLQKARPKFAAQRLPHLRRSQPAPQDTLLVDPEGLWLSAWASEEVQSRPVRCLPSHAPCRDASAFAAFLDKACLPAALAGMSALAATMRLTVRLRRLALQRTAVAVPLPVLCTAFVGTASCQAFRSGSSTRCRTPSRLQCTVMVQTQLRIVPVYPLSTVMPSLQVCAH